MGQLRTVLTAAAVIFLLAATGLYFVPLDGFWGVMTMIAGGVLASFALGSVVFLMFTLFPAKEDLWDSGFFKYMRALYGSAWGGHEKPYHIDACRASRLSAIVAVLGLLTLAVAAAFWYINVNAIASNFGQFGFFDFVRSIIREDAPILASFYFLEIMLFLFYLIAGGVFLWPVIIKNYQNIFLTAVLAVWGATMVGALIMMIAVAPIMYYGWMPWLKVAGTILGVCVVMLAVGILIVLACKLLYKKLSGSLRERTVPGQLLAATGRGWKSKVCPIITQKEE